MTAHDPLDLAEAVKVADAARLLVAFRALPDDADAVRRAEELARDVGYLEEEAAGLATRLLGLPGSLPIEEAPR